MPLATANVIGHNKKDIYIVQNVVTVYGQIAEDIGSMVEVYSREISLAEGNRVRSFVSSYAVSLDNSLYICYAKEEESETAVHGCRVGYISLVGSEKGVCQDVTSCQAYPASCSRSLYKKAEACLNINIRVA